MTMPISKKMFLSASTRYWENYEKKNGLPRPRQRSRTSKGDGKTVPASWPAPFLSFSASAQEDPLPALVGPHHADALGAGHRPRQLGKKGIRLLRGHGH